jgi:hypothetical protein
MEEKKPRGCRGSKVNRRGLKALGNGAATPASVQNPTASG